MLTRFIFLDRDGTLVRDVGYPHRLEDYELLEGVTEALRMLSGAGYRLAIITNQSGIGRGYYGHEDYARFQERLLADLAAAGIEIAGTFYCPHAPSDGCECRKPEPALLYRARDRLGADLAASWMIGDAASDVEAARRAGCRGAVRLTAQDRDAPGDGFERRAENLLAAAQLLAAEPDQRAP